MFRKKFYWAFNHVNLIGGKQIKRPFCCDIYNPFFKWLVFVDYVLRSLKNGNALISNLTNDSVSSKSNKEKRHIRAYRNRSDWILKNALSSNVWGLIGDSNKFLSPSTLRLVVYTKVRDLNIRFIGDSPVKDNIVV